MEKSCVFMQRIIILVMGILITGEISAQTDWIKYENNPIIDIGPAGTWDSRFSGPTSVIFHDGVYKGWLIGVDEMDVGRIGYATSTDGIEWTKYVDNPVLVPGSPGEWDDSNTDHACVLIIDGTYKMWYMGEDSNSARIGYATSTDGVAWEKYDGNPVLDLGSAGAWDETEVMHPSVYFDGSTYHMWYNGYGQDVQRTGYATSEDGINWTKFAGNPVLNVGESMAWDDYMLALMGVVFYDNEYKMWYTGGDGTAEDERYFRIGYATSPDGVSWSKYENNPVLDIGDAGSWDSMGVVTSAVLIDTSLNIYKMWYGGLDGSYARTGYATSGPVVGVICEPARISSAGFKLHQNYPNPFDNTTTISFSLSEAHVIKLTIYDVLGNEIGILAEGFYDRGNYSLELYASNLPGGIYYYRLQFPPNRLLIRKMVIIK